MNAQFDTNQTESYASIHGLSLNSPYNIAINMLNIMAGVPINCLGYKISAVF